MLPKETKGDHYMSDAWGALWKKASLSLRCAFFILAWTWSHGAKIKLTESLDDPDHASISGLRAYQVVNKMQ